MPEKYYVRGDSKSIFESMTKEEILAAITQAVEGGTVGDIDSGFVTKIKEIHSGNELRFWVGTSAEYNALAETDNNVLYILTDDTSAADINSRFTEHDAQLATQAAAIAANAAAIAARTVKMTSAQNFGEIAAGAKAQQTIPVSAEIMAAANNSPAVIVSPILGASDTYNDDLEFYGYIISNGDSPETGTLVFGVYNSGATAADSPDVICKVI